MSQYNDHQDGNRANRDRPRSFQDISLSYDERQIASIVNHTVSETLRSISRPTGGYLRTGYPSVDTPISSGDSRSLIRCCLKFIEEEYGLENIRNVYFRSLKEYVQRPIHSERYPSDTEILNYISTTIPWIRADRHPFIINILDCMKRCITAETGGSLVTREYRPGSQSNWRDLVENEQDASMLPHMRRIVHSAGNRSRHEERVRNDDRGRNDDRRRVNRSSSNNRRQGSRYERPTSVSYERSRIGNQCRSGWGRTESSTKKRSAVWGSSGPNKKSSHDVSSSRTHESNEIGNQSDSTSIVSTSIVSTSSVKNSTLKESDMKEVTSDFRALKEVIHSYNHPPPKCYCFRLLP